MYKRQDVVQVTAGNWHSMALKANGTVYAWGWGQYGQLGNGYTTNSYDSDQYIGEKIYSAPVQVLNGEQASETGYLKEVVQIDAMGGTGRSVRIYKKAGPLISISSVRCKNHKNS